MAVSVRMDPLLERQLEQAAKRQGVTKSRFIVDAVERALGRKNPYERMLALKAEEKAPEYQAVTKAYAGEERAYTPAAARKTIVRKLKAKHDGGAG
jgi:RHH-type rel operon transcriptional repressor/antitoxin RelB